MAKLEAATHPSARNYSPCFRENQPKRSFSIKRKRAFWACFRENWVYKFGHRTLPIGTPVKSERIARHPADFIVNYIHCR